MNINPFAITTSTPKPGLWARMKLGGLALDLARWTGEVVKSLDPMAVLTVIGKVVDLERNRRGTPGVEKLQELLAWVRDQYPGASGGVSSVASFVSALVALLNAVQVFRK
jgi:hypothetical protein